ncbi:IS630 family transposase [Paenibacillus farraposensis]|uniref:IS630 family transposase n=1 Tax=Paenibacillus farraposensis TaxID=2807095 RepID=A0ABW4DJU5_9BACL|nr:IS630 family transposase [Paenibacillus farraposensis]
MEQHIELEHVKAAMKQAKERRMYERYQAIYLHLKGTPMTAIADILNRNRMTVSSYIHTYENGGLAALQLKHSSGAPTRLTKEQQDQLKQTVAYSVPHEVGFTAKHNWTLELIATYVEREWGHRYSLRGISKVMERLGLSYTKPTFTLAAADPEKQRQFAEMTFPDLKKLLNHENDHLLFEDESMIRDYQAIQKTWFLRGKQRIIPTTGKHRGVKLLATVDYRTGRIVWQEDEHTAETFLTFLQKVLSAYPAGSIVIVLDNARIHHAKLLQPFLEEQKGRLELVFLPPYSPQLNIVEGLWKWLKSSVINNVFYSTVTEIRLRVGQFIDEIMKHPHAIIDRLCVRL